jgi:hypothetical protein
VIESVATTLQRWNRGGAALQPGMRAADVVARLAGAGRVTSSDVLGLFAACDGMRDGESDDHFFCLWPLDRCVRECAHFDERHIPFADFLLDSCTYCFRRESEDRSSVLVTYTSGEEFRQVAYSVEEFFHLLLTDRARLDIGL